MSAEELSCSFNPIDIWNKEYQVKSITLSNGSLKLKINEKGLIIMIYINQALVIDDQPFNLQLNSILFRKMRFSYENNQNKQLYQTTLRNFELKVF